MASAAWYSSAIIGQWSATAARRIDWVGDTIMCSLHASGYVPDQDTHDFLDDLTNEASAGNYARQTLGTKSVVYDSVSNTISFRAAQTTFPNLTATVRYAVIWKSTGTPSTSPLLGFSDLGAQSISATNFNLTWSATDGVLKAVVS